MNYPDYGVYRHVATLTLAHITGSDMHSCYVTAVMPTEFCYHYITHRRIFVKSNYPQV